MEGRGSIKIQREPQYIKVFSSYVRANKRKQVKIVSTVHFMSPNISKMLSFQQVINKNYWDILVFFFFFLVMSLNSGMRITHLQPISVGTSHVSSTQEPHETRGHHTAGRGAGEQGSHAPPGSCGHWVGGRQITKAHPGGYFTYEHPRRLPPVRMC